MQRNAETLSLVIHQSLKRKKILLEDVAWEIRKSPFGGFGVFAKRPIESGEILFKDPPIILGPRASITCPLICVNCYKKEELKPCIKSCGLLLCPRSECQNSENHQKECKIIRQWTRSECQDISSKLTKVLSPIRSLLLSSEDKEVVRILKAHKSEQHGFEVDVMKNVLGFEIKEDDEMFMRHVCSVLDSNAFEVIVGNEDNQSSVKGLYSLGSLCNHCCAPNTSHVFDKNQTMIVRASRFIKSGEEICHSYSRFIWGTQTRRFHLLRTKHFLCKCSRCEDPTEFGSYMSAIYCKVCKIGKVTPLDSLSVNSKWQCESCGVAIDRSRVASVNSLLGSILKTLTNDDLKYMLRCIESKFPEVIPENNEAVVELKYRIIWILGYQKNYEWTELPGGLLLTKEKYCRDLLKLLETLRLGQCKMRGLLLYELYCVLKELKTRQERSGKEAKVFDREMRDLLVEAADILMYDVGAPEEIQKIWKNEE